MRARLRSQSRDACPVDLVDHPCQAFDVKGHGLIRDDGCAVEFRFGTLSLLGAVAATWYINPVFGERPACEWPYRPVDGSFERALARVRSSFFSLDRAALHMDACLRILNDRDRQIRDGMHLDDAVPWMNAHEDVHLYADLILHYLYDYSNGLAMMLARFFAADNPRPSDRSFYKHRTSVEGALLATSGMRGSSNRAPAGSMPSRRSWTTQFRA